MKLISNLETTTGVTVLDLACKVGACEVIQLLVTMDEVMAFKVGRWSARLSVFRSWANQRFF